MKTKTESWEKSIREKINGISAYDYSVTTEEIISSIRSLLQQAKQEGIEEAIKKVEKMDNKYYAGYICIEEDKISELKKKDGGSH